MAQYASSVYAPVVKVLDGGGINVRRQWQGVADKAVFEAGNEV